MNSSLELIEGILPFVFLICSAVIIAVVGSKRSLQKSDSEEDEQEVIDFSSSAKFPFIAGRALFLLYVLLKFIPRNLFTAVLSFYLTVCGTFGFNYSMRSIVGSSVILGVLSLLIGVAYFYCRHWMLTNLLSYGLGICAIEGIRLSSYQAAALMLSGLFFYDIFFVFGTDVMVTVATSIDGPIKLLFPAKIFTGGPEDRLSLLGLGDIVIPGFYIAFMCVFSYKLSKRRNGLLFWITVVAYFVSLVQTIVFMLIYKHAQPALLYISPWLIISTNVAAFFTGDLTALWIDEAEGEKKNSNAQEKIEKKSKIEHNEESLLQVVKDFFGFEKEKKKIK